MLAKIIFLTFAVCISHYKLLFWRGHANNNVVFQVSLLLAALAAPGAEAAPAEVRCCMRYR